MKFVTFKGRDGEEIEYMRLDYDEELETARLFCEMLDRLSLEDFPDVYDKVYHLFIKKSFGNDFRFQEFQELYESIEVYNARWDEEYTEKYGLPDISNIQQSDDCIDFGVVPANIDEVQNLEDRKTRYRREVARAWKEAWDERPKGYLRQRFPRFPGIDLLEAPKSSQELREIDLKRELKFWSMVDEKQEFFKCSREQAIREVSDYMPRAVNEHNRINDHDPERVVNPVIDMEEWYRRREEELDE